VVQVLPYLHGAAEHSVFLHVLRLQQLQKREGRGGEKRVTSSSLTTFLPSLCPAWLLTLPGGKGRKSERGEERDNEDNKLK